MDGEEQTEHFSKELDRLIQRFRQEYSLTYASAVGTLNIKATELILQGIAERDQE